MKFERRKLSFDIYGEKCEVLFPTTGQIKEKDELIKKKENKGREIDVVIDFLETLGLPRDISLGMEMDHLLKIISEVSGQKKA